MQFLATKFLVTKMKSLIFACVALFSLAAALPAAQNNSNDSALTPAIIDGFYPENQINYFQVAIVSDASSPPVKLCSGVLIRTDWVLTSAYCVKSKQVLRVILGAFTIDSVMLGQEGILVDKIIPHPYYNSVHMLHDIALLYVKGATNAEFVTLAALPSLPVSYNEYVGQYGIISGYGRPGNSEILNNYFLISKQVEIIDNVFCTQEGHYMNYYKLCSAGRAVCEGDQGGPLVIGNTVVGIASAALKALDCEGQISATYTRVNYYRQWIEQTINCRC